MEVNLNTRLDRDTSHLAPRIPRSTSLTQPRDATGNPLLPLMTVFPALGYIAPHLRPVAIAAQRQTLSWSPAAAVLPSSSKHVRGTNAPTSSGRNEGTWQELPVNPIIPATGLDPGCILNVRSKGRRGVSLSDILVTWVMEEPDEQGVVCREAVVELDAVRDVVDCPDWCVCHLVQGPTIRVAGIGAEWRGSLVEQPGYPAQKQKSVCFTFGKLIRLVIEQFLTWWANEKESRVKRMSVFEASQEPLPFVPGPGTISLENVVLVAIRRRHIALEVYEWLPEIEVIL